MSDLDYTLDEAIGKVSSGDYRIYYDCKTIDIFERITE